MDAAGRVTTCEVLEDEAVAPGRGRSPGLIRRTTPGLSARQSPNAAAPTSGADCPNTAPAPNTAVKAAIAAAVSKRRGRSNNLMMSDSCFSWRLPVKQECKRCFVPTNSDRMTMPGNIQGIKHDLECLQFRATLFAPL